MLTPIVEKLRYVCKKVEGEEAVQHSLSLLFQGRDLANCILEECSMLEREIVKDFEYYKASTQRDIKLAVDRMESILEKVESVHPQIQGMVAAFHEAKEAGEPTAPIMDELHCLLHTRREHARKALLGCSQFDSVLEKLHQTHQNRLAYLKLCSESMVDRIVGILEKIEDLFRSIKESRAVAQEGEHPEDLSISEADLLTVQTSIADQEALIQKLGSWAPFEEQFSLRGLFQALQEEYDALALHVQEEKTLDLVKDKLNTLVDFFDRNSDFSKGVSPYLVLVVRQGVSSLLFLEPLQARLETCVDHLLNLFDRNQRGYAVVKFRAMNVAKLRQTYVDVHRNIKEKVDGFSSSWSSFLFS